MRRPSAWLVRAICGILVLAAATRAGAEPVSVVTFNLFHGGPLSGLTGDAGSLDDRLGMVVAELRRLRPDIIALQETSRSSRRGDVALRLARELGYHVAQASTTERVFGRSILSRLAVALIDFSEGPAVLSRWPIVARHVVELARCGRPLDTRVLLRVDVDAPGGRLRVYSTHTSGEACQLRHIERVARDGRTGLPSILMGDFNASERMPALASMPRHAGFLDAFRTANPNEPGFTDLQWPGAKKPTVSQRYDYVFVVPGARTAGSVLGSRVVLNAPRRYADGSVLWPSDHYGVLAVLDLTAR